MALLYNTVNNNGEWLQCVAMWHGSLMVNTSDSQSKGCRFNSPTCNESGHVVHTHVYLYKAV